MQQLQDVENFIAKLKLLQELLSRKDRFLKLLKCYYNSEQIIIFTELIDNGSLKGAVVKNPLTEEKALKYL
jgi:hypothetical protein